jgi:hypothetical protein
LTHTEQQTVRKTYKEKFRPTPAQERALDEVLWHCRDLANTTLEQRITAWQRCHVSISRFEQEAELKAIRAGFPAFGNLPVVSSRRLTQVVIAAAVPSLSPLWTLAGSPRREDR